MTYQEAVEYIEKIPMFTKKTGLSNTRAMLELLGNPEAGMTVAHVAGTNGKGSVCAMLASVLQKSGRRTGLFTSPHLVELRERIQIEGKPVSEECFAEACERLCRLAGQLEEQGGQHPAYFEFLFGMAMDIFARERVCAAVIETGLGGRLDATNAVAHPAVTVITPVSMDHMEYLGDTIEEIAAEKAGIIKTGIPVVYWAQDARAAGIIEAEAAAKNAEIRRIDGQSYKILKIGNKDIDFYAFSSYYENSLFTIPFSAPYQAANARLALEAAAVLNESGRLPGQEISLEEIRDGLRGTDWQGRMEEVCPDIYVDGAHNEDGIRAFTEAVRAKQDEREKYLLFSAVKEKDCESMARLLCGGIRWKGIILTEIEGGRRLACDELKTAFLHYTEYAGTEIEAYPDIRTAFALAKERKGDTGVLYCAGSLYLVGEIKKLLRECG